MGHRSRMILWRFSLREIRSRPGRAALTVLSVVLGVASVVSVTLATGAARTAYKDLFAARAGKADLVVMSSHKPDLSKPLQTWATLSCQVSVLCPCPVLLVK